MAVAVAAATAQARVYRDFAQKCKQKHTRTQSNCMESGGCSESALKKTTAVRSSVRALDTGRQCAFIGREKKNDNKNIALLAFGRPAHVVGG